jgi:hypothetical protein
MLDTGAVVLAAGSARELGEELGYSLVENRAVVTTGLVTRVTSSQLLPTLASTLVVEFLGRSAV